VINPQFVDHPALSLLLETKFVTLASRQQNAIAADR
jgi:hypothetical protein